MRITVKSSTIRRTVRVPGKKGKTQVGSGGPTFGGSAPVSFGRVFVGSGGLRIDGEAPKGIGHVPLVAAQRPHFILGGSAEVKAAIGAAQSFSYVGSGGISPGGGAPIQMTQGQTTITIDPTGPSIGLAYLGAGGITPSGSAPVSVGIDGALETYEEASTGTRAFSFVSAGGDFGAEGGGPSAYTGTLLILDNDLPEAYQGVPYSWQLQALGGDVAGEDAVWSMGLGAVPTGLVLGAGGILEGAPGTNGSFLLKVQLQRGSKFVTKNLILKVNPTPTPSGIEILQSTLPPARIGIPYLIQVQGVSESGLPLTYKLQTSTISGVYLTEEGYVQGITDSEEDKTYQITATVEDGVNHPIIADLKIDVIGIHQIVITTPSDLPTAIVGSVYSFKFEQTGATGSPTWTVVRGLVPSGLQLLPVSGELVGKPTSAPGTYLFTVAAAYGTNITGEIDVSMQIIASAAFNYVGSGGPAFGGLGSERFGLNIVPATAGPQMGGSAPAVFTPAAAASAFSFTGGGLIQIGGSASASFLPATTGAYARLTFRDGTILQINEGDVVTYTTGLGAGTLNAPNSSPGLAIRMTSTELEIRNKGVADGFAGALGNPVYFQSLMVHIPGKTIYFGQEYYGVTQTGTDDYQLIAVNDPKHTSRTATITSATYSPSRDFHFLEGGEAIHYRFAPIGDPAETSLIPAQAQIDDALALLNLATTRIAAYPMLDHVMNLYQHVTTGPGAYNNPAADQKAVRMTWLTKIANIDATHANNQITHLNPMPYTKWYGGMWVMTPDGTGMLRPGMYMTEAWFAVDWLRHGASHIDSYHYGLAQMRHKIATSMTRFDTANQFKNMWRNESNGYVSANSPAPYPAQIHKSGTAGVYFPCNAKSWDLGLAIWRLLRPDDALITDAFDRRVSQLLTTTYPPAGSGTFFNGGELRMGSWLLNSLWYFYRVHQLLGNTATANQLKAKAETFIEGIFVAINQAPGATKPLWIPCTTNPTTTPMTASSISGAGEGIYIAMAHWMADAGTNPTRLAYFKLMCAWAMDNLSRPLANGRREWAYYFVPNMSGGGTTWNGPPTVTYNGGHHHAWMVALEPYMETWYPATYTSRFVELNNFLQNYPGFSPAVTGAMVSGNGAMNYDAWPQKWTGIVAWAGLG